MTKADLVEEVTQLGDLTRRDGEMIVDTIFDSVIHALRTGDKIEIRGFGSFRIRQRKPRTGRNPKTGAKVDVPAKRVPYFKPSKELRDLVNPKDKAPSRMQTSLNPPPEQDLEMLSFEGYGFSPYTLHPKHRALAPGSWWCQPGLQRLRKN